MYCDVTFCVSKKPDQGEGISGPAFSQYRERV